jgi:hypothetical protein
VCQLWPLVLSLGLNNPTRIGFKLAKSRIKKIRRRKQGDCRYQMTGTGFHSFVANPCSNTAVCHDRNKKSFINLHTVIYRQCYHYKWEIRHAAHDLTQYCISNSEPLRICDTSRSQVYHGVPQQDSPVAIRSQIYTLDCGNPRYNYFLCSIPRYYYFLHTELLKYILYCSAIDSVDISHLAAVKGIVSPDWKGLHMFSLDRFEV